MVITQPDRETMNLAGALRATKYRCLAFVGAGGKSSAMFRVAQELPPPVILAVTTHLAVTQTVLADKWFVAETIDDLPEAAEIEGLRVLVTGPQDDVGKVGGLSEPVLDKLYLLAEQLGCPLLVEADGARQCSLKAPAEYEPVIPSFCDLVVVVAGLSGLDNPLDDRYVHRVERFAELSELDKGQPVTTEAIIKVLLHPQGGLKNIPVGAHQVVLLNQADSDDLQAQAKKISVRLLEKYEAVLVARLQSGDIGGKKNEQNLSSQGVFAVHQHIGGVILAAGGARRFGAPKLLLPWKGEAIIRQVAKTALAAGLTPVVVVVGEQVAETEAAVAGLDVKFVFNSDWESGQSSSVRAGLKALPPNLGGVIFLLGDQPRIPATLVKGLIEVHAASLSPLVAPLVDGQRGNPVLFDRETFADLMAIRGDMGGRALFSKYPVKWFPWHDADVLLDIDTPQDYQRLQDAT